jgi:hypothetical protein
MANNTVHIIDASTLIAVRNIASAAVLSDKTKKSRKVPYPRMDQAVQS